MPQRPRRFVYIPNIIDERFFGMKRTPEPGLVLFTGGARAIKGWPLLAAAWPAGASGGSRRPSTRRRMVRRSADRRSRVVGGDAITFEPWLSV